MEETMIAKRAYERVAREYGVAIRHYRADNLRFNDLRNGFNVLKHVRPKERLVLARKRFLIFNVTMLVARNGYSIKIYLFRTSVLHQPSLGKIPIM